MLKKLTLALFLFAATLSAQETDLSYFVQKATENYQNKNYAESAKNFRRALEMAPQSQALKYNLACATCLSGNNEEALKLLNELVDAGGGMDAENDPDFTSLRNTPEFNALLEKIKKLKAPIVNSSKAFTVHEKDLIPEGIAYDSKTGSFFLSSLYKAKILKISPDGKTENFTSENQDGLWSVVGMKADAEKGLLYAASSFTATMKNADPGDQGRAGIFKFDIASGKLVKKYIAPGNNHFFNDLAFTKEGDIYVTDSQSPAVYFISKDTDSLKLYLNLAGFQYPNGIALSDDGQSLFVAHSSGILKVDLKKKTYSSVVAADNISLDFCDGMYFYKNSLIGVQNSNFNRIARFYLDNTLRRVTKMEVLEANNPDFIIPTTGTIKGDELYFIATSQLRAFDENGKIFPEEKLKDVLILKLKL
ncbi:MAG: TPR end-of-group domain-containing protein [Bacteroidota bacterium]|jgi:sugar lactone lactonase YvrE|nr:tetratricopeptide repeat protein [Ignavibacteria bacterium]MCU7500561.1 tetratricopeptide repeat protein [Ignavibacteria bacterium]MCU7513134.1 tetratricopeptide repeat protein [Ignavibacteria bacterium]MCU7521108.1 tetratricopeptide repeat protein [Ignavibacteria bacterium]